MKAWIQSRLKDFSFGDLALGSVLSLAIRIGGVGLAYVMQVLLARWLEAAEYGAFTYLYSWLMVLAMFGSLGLPSASVRFVPQYLGASDWPRLRGVLGGYRVAALLSSGALTLMVAFVLYISAPLRTWLSVDQSMFWALALIPLLSLVSLESEQCRALGRMVPAYVPTMILRPVLVPPAVLILGYYFGLSREAALGGALLASALVLVVQHLWTLKIVPRELRGSSARREWRQWFRVALPLLLIAGFFILLERIDILMLGSLADEESTGFYNAAARTATFVGFALVAVNSALVPRVSKLLAEGKHEEIQRILFRGSRWSLGPALPAAALMLLAGGPILSLFGAGFSEGGHVALIILTLGHLVNSAAGPVGQLLNISGHQNISLAIYGVTALLNIAMNWVLIPQFGATGAAIATSLSMVCWNVAQYIVVVRRLHLWPSFLIRPRRLKSQGGH